MPVLTLSDGSILAFIARVGERLEPIQRERLIARLAGDDAKRVAMNLLDPVVTLTEDQRRAADQLRSLAAGH